MNVHPRQGYGFTSGLLRIRRDFPLISRSAPDSGSSVHEDSVYTKEGSNTACLYTSDTFINVDHGY